MVNGPNLGVWTTSNDTTTWFETFFYLFGTPESPERQSPISEEKLQKHLPDSNEQLCTGILTRVEFGENIKPPFPQTTEIVFYLSQPIANAERFPEPLPEPAHPFRARFGEYCVHALPLSSELLKAINYQALDPPLSTKDATGSSNRSNDEAQGQFLVPIFEAPKESLEHALKRKRAISLFEEATERRRKANRYGGESIAFFASKYSQQDSIPQSGPSIESQSQKQNETTLLGSSNGVGRPSIGHLRSQSTGTSSVHRPSSRKESRLPVITDGAVVSLLEERNKETISRVVMAGMRLFGLSPRSRKLESRRQSVVPESQSEQEKEGTSVPPEADTYKLVYHQTFKGAVFAFRKHMHHELLHLKTERVREVVDQLLTIFCCDPLEEIPESDHEAQASASQNGELQDKIEDPTDHLHYEDSETVQQQDVRRRENAKIVDSG